MLKIGTIKLKSRFILAPMAGISDLAFRIFNHRYGAELAFCEMINVRSLGYKSKKTENMLRTTKEDKPLGVQILGSEEEYIKRGLDILKNFKFDILDFNAACPERKVTRRGEGASLLKDPKKLNRLLKIIIDSLSVPVTVKIRLGWDKSSKIKDIALACQGAGISALFVHGRTKVQGYSGTVDYTAIRKVKKLLNVPVIASGDVFSFELAKKMFDETGCDGLLVARGSFGNPWIFKELEEFFENGKIVTKPGINEIVKAMVEQLDLCVKFNTERIGVVMFRKFFIWYSKSLPSVRYLRNKACASRTRRQMLAVIKELNLKGLPRKTD